MSIFSLLMMLFVSGAEAANLNVVHPANGLYSLQPMCAPSKELTVHNASTANGANVIIWDINSNWHTQKSHQKWNVQRIGNTEWYKILAENSGSALNIHNGIAADGTNVSIWPFGGNMHKFRFLNAGNGYYVLQGHVEGDYVLDVSGSSNTNGTNVQIWKYNGSSAQKWKLVKRNSSVLKGDVDDNGKVELADLNLLQKYLSNARISINKNNSDLNGDGRITIIDVSQLKSKLNQNNISTPNVLKGDVDGNGKVELADLNLLQKYLSNARISINKNNSDLNGDGRITIIDVSQLKSKLNQNNISAPNVVSKYVKLNVPYFKQDDPDWKDTLIGSRTIKDRGCLLTSLAMKHSYHTNKKITPDVMKNLVSFGGPNGNDFIWDSLKNVGYVSYNKNSKMTNSLMKEIYQALKNNKPVIVGNANIHWVIVYGYSGDDTINFDVTKFNILDPGTTRRTNLKQFLDEKTSKIQKIIY